MRLSRQGKISRTLVAAGATAPLILGSALFATSTVNAQPTSATGYSGRSCAVLLQGVKLAGATLLQDQCVGDSGQLPAAGGSANGPTGPIAVGGLLTANVAVASAVGAVQPAVGPVSTAASKVVGLTVLPGVANPIAGLPSLTPDLVDATVLASSTSVNCTGIQTPTSTTVAAVTVSGNPINITGSPNQSITIPLVGTITLNRQVYDASSNTATGEALVLDLNVLGVTGTGLVSGHIALAHSESDLAGCSTAGAAPKTGGGLPSTGSLAPNQNISSNGTGLRAVALPLGISALVVTGLMVGLRRRRDLAADLDKG